MGELSKLKGLGAKSECWLNQVGIYSYQQLKTLGAVKAYLQLERQSIQKPSLNFLYALVGALEDRPWQEVAQQERGRLLTELASAREFDELINPHEN